MSEKLTITLTGRRPVTITKAAWPVIAQDKTWDNTYECQANRIWRLTVRQHEDGRTVVYGAHISNYQGARDVRGGELLDAGDDTPAAIHRVAETTGCGPEMAERCIAELPAEEI